MWQIKVFPVLLWIKIGFFFYFINFTIHQGHIKYSKKHLQKQDSTFMQDKRLL